MRFRKKDKIWVAVDIYLKEEVDIRKFVLEFIPKALTGDVSWESYHFIFEPFITFRIKCKPSYREGKRNWVEALLKAYDNKVGKYIFDDNYYGEEKSYGKNGWPIMEKMLYMGSEAAITIMRDNKLFKNRDWFLSRFWHCLFYQINPPPTNNNIVWLEEVKKYVASAFGYLGVIERTYCGKKKINE